MQNPELNGQVSHQAEEQSYSSIKVNLKEEEEEEEQSAEKIKAINPELEQHPDWSEGISAEISLYKEELSECDNSNQEETKSEETDELRLSHRETDGILLVLQDDCGSSEGGTITESEVCQKDAGSTDTKSQHSKKTDPLDKITTQEQHDDESETEETCQPGTGGNI